MILPTTGKPIYPETTVYSFYLPEVQPIVDDLVADFPHHVYERNWDPGLEDLHLPLLDSYERAMADDQCITGLGDFPHRYVTNGSSEAIFHLLAREKARGPRPLYQLAGEYQGYEAYAKALDLEIESIPREWLLKGLGTYPEGLFILSNPSAIDGNWLDEDLVTTISERHNIILDLAYAGMADAEEDAWTFDPRFHQPVEAVVASLSKPYGLYYHRIGMCWAQEPIDSLYGTRWFKNAFSILLGTEVLSRLPFAEVRRKYQGWQQDALDEIAPQFPWSSLCPSDVWLLAHGRKGAAGWFPELASFQRGDSARLCLTPYYQRRTKEKDV